MVGIQPKILISSILALCALALAIALIKAALPQKQEMVLQGLEVTQAIQALNPSAPKQNNIVPLIKNKTTIVRAYLTGIDGKQGDPTGLSGSLRVMNPGDPDVVIPSMQPRISPVPFEPEHQNLYATLDFQLAESLTSADSITLQGPVDLRFEGDPIPKKLFRCWNCDHKVSVRFVDSPPLRVKLVGIRFTWGNDYYNKLLPRKTDYDLIKLWLQRAYPVDPTQVFVGDEDSYDIDVKLLYYYQDKLDYSDDRISCALANWFLSTNKRPYDLVQVSVDHPLRFTHYLGLLYDGGKDALFFKYGCSQGIASAPHQPQDYFGTVSTAPTGPLGKPEPPWYGDLGIRELKLFLWKWAELSYWDDDDGDGEVGSDGDSYGDWYAGHELGHLFGLVHVDNETVDSNRNVCHTAGAPSASYPYEKGQLSNSDGTYLGFDTKESDPLKMMSLPGRAWHDLMTYCVRQWISSYSYQWIWCQLHRENNTWNRLLGRSNWPLPGACRMPHLRVHPDALAVEKAEHAPPAKPTPRPEVREYISVLVAINLKAGSGKIQFTAPLPEPGVEAGRKDQRAQIRVVHASGPPSDYPVTVPTSSGRLSEEGKTDWATATVPYSPDLKGVELVVAGQVVDQRLVSRHPPVLENIRLSSAPEKGEYTKEALGQVSFEWDARDMDGDPLSYTVQVSRDQGKSWQTVGILSHPNLDLPLERLKGSSTVMLRVLASDGFNITTLTSETFDLSKSHEVLPKKGTPGGKTGD